MAHPGPQLRTIREAHGLSQARLAEILGVNKGTLSRWEDGTHKIPYDTLQRWGAALGHAVHVIAVPVAGGTMPDVAALGQEQAALVGAVLLAAGRLSDAEARMLRAMLEAAAPAP